MDLKQLRYFVAVAENESFSKASALLSISQPALSRQLSGIEAEFGVELLCRNGRGVTLTEPGRQLLASARLVLENVEHMRSEMMAISGDPIGEVIMGMPPMIGDRLIPPLVKQFRASFPKVSLHIIEGISGHVYEWLSTGRVDVAILYNPPATGALVTEPVLRDDVGLVGPASAPDFDGASVTVQELRAVPLIMPSRAHGVRTLAEGWAASNGIRLSITLQVDAFHATLELVKAGAGYTMLPFAAVCSEVNAGLLRFWTLPEPSTTSAFVLAASTQRARTPATRYLLNSVREQMRLLVKTGSWRQNKAGHRSPPSKLHARGNGLNRSPQLSVASAAARPQ